MKAADRPIQRPLDARLLIVDARGCLTHARRSRFVDLLRAGDLVVANDAATLPASLHGMHMPTGAPIEVRLAARSSLSPGDVHRFAAVIFGAGDFHIRTVDRPLPPGLAAGDRLVFGVGLDKHDRDDSLSATIEALLDHPRLVRLRFDGSPSTIWEGFARHGRPIQYAHLNQPLDLWDVWTPIAGLPVAFEPPSAGFALDWRTILTLRDRGVAFATITLAAGISSTGDPALDGRLPFDEPYRISDRTASVIAETRAAGGRIVAVGTTVVRALEHAAARDGVVRPGNGVANQRMGPTSRLRIVNAILSGTHEPDSSHYQLLRAFVDDETLSEASAALEACGYRTHEFGDSVLIEKSDRIAGEIASACGLSHREHFLRLGQRQPRGEPSSPLEVQECLLAPQQPAVPAELSALVDDTMAGNDDRDSIQAVGPSDGTLRSRRADSSCEIFIRSRLSERDALQFGPHAFLERRAGRREGHGELSELSGEIGLELRAQAVEMRRLARDNGAIESLTNGFDLRRQLAAVGELEQADPLCGGAGDERPQRALDPCADDAIAGAAAPWRLSECSSEGVAKPAV